MASSNPAIRQQPRERKILEEQRDESPSAVDPEAFRWQGFVTLPGLFSREQIASLRSAVEAVYAKGTVYSGDTAYTRMDPYSRYAELRWVLFHPPLVAACRQLFGTDYRILPDHAAARGFYSGWHKDTDVQELAGHREHWSEDFRMGQLGIYLQDNDPIIGGGIDVVPGSHREPRHRAFAASARKTLKDKVVVLARTSWQRVNRVLQWTPRSAEDDRKYSIPSKAGDVVIFDYRMTHQATQPVLPDLVRSLPRERVKYALFCSLSANDEHARRYCRFVRGREDYVFYKNHSYPVEMQEQARSLGIGFAE